MINKPLHEIQQDLRNKKFSLKELISEQVRLIKTSSINAVTYLNESDYDFDAIDDQSKPLYGLTVLHKDNIAVNNMPMTCASKMLKDFVAPYNATLVERMNAAGAITLGKTNLDEFAMGSSTIN